MKGLFNRASFAAAGVFAVLAAAAPSEVCAAPAASASAISAPEARLADSFKLDLAVLLPGLSTGPQDLSRYAVNEVENRLVLYDGLSVDSGFNVDVARLLDSYAPTAGAYNGLFYSSAALNSPYASLSSGGSFVGASLALADDLHLRLGQASSAPGLNYYLLTPRLALARLGGAGLPYDARSTDTLFAGVSWNFAKWGSLGFTASQTTERGGALGESNAAIEAARTSALGVSAHVGLGGGWVTTASYSEGITQLDLRPGAPAGAQTSLRSEAYGIAVAKHGVFGNDALGLALSRPAPGSGSFSTGTSSDMQFFSRNMLFAGASPETDIELGYITTFLDGPVALQANASYQMNLDGRGGINAISLLSRAKIKF